jgi:hypothetical protein
MESSNTAAVPGATGGVGRAAAVRPRRDSRCRLRESHTRARPVRARRSPAHTGAEDHIRAKGGPVGLHRSDQDWTADGARTCAGVRAYIGYGLTGGIETLLHLNARGWCCKGGIVLYSAVEGADHACLVQRRDSRSCRRDRGRSGSPPGASIGNADLGPSATDAAAEAYVGSSRAAGEACPPTVGGVTHAGAAGRTRCEIRRAPMRAHTVALRQSDWPTHGRQQWGQNDQPNCGRDSFHWPPEDSRIKYKYARLCVGDNSSKQRIRTRPHGGPQDSSVPPEPRRNCRPGSFSGGCWSAPGVAPEGTIGLRRDILQLPYTSLPRRAYANSPRSSAAANAAAESRSVPCRSIRKRGTLAVYEPSLRADR